MTDPTYDQLRSARPPGGFSLIMADNPWSFKTWSAKGEAKSPQVHYSCTPLTWIKGLPVEEVAARDSVLWLWAINPMLPHALEVLDAWGFEFKTMGYWVKRTKHGKLGFGTGHILRGAGEPFLIGTRGKPLWGSKSVRSVIEGPLREHSRKPEEAYQAAAKLVPFGSRLDLFTRTRREGWHAFGDELDKFAA